MQKNNIKIIFFGTSDFAVSTLEALVKVGYEVVAVITTPDEPAGRKKVLTPPSVKVAAKKFNLDIWQPRNLKIENLNLIKNWKLKIGNCDLGIVAAYGKIIPKEIIGLPRLGLINIHPSLLPKYRGPTPIQSTILNGEEETGVTIIELDEEVDHGSIISVSNKVEVGDKNYKSLHDELALLGTRLLIKTLPDFLENKIIPKEQDHIQATFTKKFSNEDGKINWAENAEAIDAKVRALNPEPGTWNIWDGKKIKILESNLSNLAGFPSNNRSENKIGSFHIHENRLFVSCGKNEVLEIIKLQIEGGKPITGKEFINGYGKML